MIPSCSKNINKAGMSKRRQIKYTHPQTNGNMMRTMTETKIMTVIINSNKKIGLDCDLVVRSPLQESSMMLHEINCILLMDYNFTLCKYDINNIKYVGLEMWKEKVYFMSSAQSSMFYMLIIMNIMLVENF
jgi:hypothetical protein